MEVIGVLAACIGLLALSAARSEGQQTVPVVECEEIVYTYEDAKNGSGPMWCYGSTCIVRYGKNLFVSGWETIRDAKPLHNVRWTLYQRSERGWQLQQKDERGRTREPAPLAVLPDGRLYLFANPTLTEPDAYSGPAKPLIHRFRADAPHAPYETLEPVWEGRPVFTEHSYRGLCVDGPNRELLAFNIVGYEAYYWSFMDRKGQWSAQGRLVFPMGTEYETPQPIRLCYPVLALSRRAAHALMVSDIIEPVKAWREYKRKVTGNEWDYDFRRLFYAWTPDITKTPFRPVIEIASRDKTAGHILNLDIWLDRQGRAHLLWLETSVWHAFMRDKFFPDVPITTSLEYAIVDRGNVVVRSTLAKGGEGASSEVPGYARFHATPDGSLFVLAYFGGHDGAGRPVSENRLMEVQAGGRVGAIMPVGLKHPFTSFMTATERGGSLPSEYIDVLGTAAGRPGISYARIRLKRGTERGR
jgi:hypothetical protein